MAQIIPLLGGVRGGPFPRFHEDKGRETSVDISRITDLPPPKSPPKRGISNLTLRKFKVAVVARTSVRIPMRTEVRATLKVAKGLICVIQYVMYLFHEFIKIGFVSAKTFGYDF